ncbi:MAG: hypothetical protein U9N77_04645 [Thermodesulfobacteriota bacterium]|nr:hypothetical protein [Thermodesulfobacteriota bacterium]
MQNRIKTNPAICSQCDAIYKSCCRLKSDKTDDMPTPVSEPEIVRIMTALKINDRNDILEEKKNSTLFISQLTSLFPDRVDSILKVFPEKGRHFELKTVNNSCIFLSVNGCTLADHDRPLFCRIYPFWFFDDQPQIFQDPACLALQKCKTVPELFLALGTNPEKLKQIHSWICRDWELCTSMSQIKMKVSM